MFWKDDEPLRPDERAFSSSDESGSERRFHSRIDAFRIGKRPVFKHHLWWLVHNVVAHPLIGVVPCSATFDFHDWTSKKINGVAR
jgi:hypothetical protein